MSEGYVPYNGEKQSAKVLSGFDRGPFYAKPNVAPAMDFKEGYPASVDEAMDYMKTPPQKPFDPWVYKRPNASMR